MGKTVKSIHISEAVAPNLMLRQNADSFFDYVEHLGVNTVAIDFKGVQFASRSFAHQYLVRRARSHIAVSEVNVPENVARMMELVASASGPSMDRHGLRLPDENTVITV